MRFYADGPNIPDQLKALTEEKKETKLVNLISIL